MLRHTGSGVFIPGELRVTTADERVEASLEVDVQAGLDERWALGDIVIEFDGTLGKAVPTASFETEFGVHGIDLAGFDLAGLRFESHYLPSGRSRGELKVFGLRDVSCGEEPCADAAPVQLGAASW